MTGTTAAPARAPWGIYLIGAFAELLFGYDTGIIGTAMLSIKKEFPLTPATQGLVVSSLLLGAAIGVGFAGRLSDRHGRRPTLLLVGAIFGVGGLVAALAPSVAILVLGRLIMGLGVGSSAVVVSVYLIEIAPTRHRGKIGALGQMMVVLGIMLAYLVGYSLDASGQWRLMLGFTLIPSVLIVCALFFAPESPRWLVQQGRDGDARTALGRLGRGGTADAELQELHRVVTTANGNRRSTGDVLREMFSPALRRSTAAGIVLAVLAQTVGTNSIVYYAPTTLAHAGFGQTAAVTANISIGVANVVFTILGIALVDRIPRRRLLLWGAIGMTVAQVFLAVFTLLQSGPSAAGAYATLVGMIVFLSSFAFAWGVLVRVVVSELFPSAIRGSASGLVLVLQWFANFVVNQFFPTILATSAALSFGIFAVVGIIAVVFVAKLLPETGAGKSLEDVEQAAVQLAR
ncbi:sugar porter family MFS transporter [Amycolatopsis sp. FDAARGOS 1241]|uniref:sugar porter family MFS transporter n=1 Tax=Amycolatopsis sp. FDAARGOS 1241 TaxID=2778070 RepID=UPI00194DB174|nr:sugar porter family MFS transporter [Amycolatopsis sp. FDAARGOS 1241]QRP44732.1 sugar porter family MFS transporter [Amycolatopsis sp. FDAARGOS 1241]